MITNKIIGYFFITIGLAVIVFVCYQSYNIFTAKTSAPLVFKIQVAEQPFVSQTQDIQKQIDIAVKQQIAQIISPGDVAKIFNLISWSIFSMVLIFAAGAVARLGVKMVL